jgi:hypothetical protein
MFQFLKRLANRLMNRGGFAEPPADPFARVRQPRRGRPGGRDSAIAVEEPEDPKQVQAVGRHRPR